MPSSYTDDLDLALRMADAADEITMQRFGAVDLVIESKPDLTPVSDADQSVERLIRTELAAARPTDAISGEEFGSEGSGARRWVIDPIDGTKNFVRGVPVWASLIALVDGEVPAVGVVSAPALGRRWWASLGDGAYARTLGGSARPLHVSKVAELSDASLSYASLGGWASLGRRDAMIDLMDSVWRTRGFGDFWSYMLIAEGAVDIAAEPELSLWDMAALAPIVTEAGGRFTGLNGHDGVHHGNAVASNSLLHDALLQAIGDPGAGS